MYDTIIIGAGPAGVTAAIYADRAGLKTLVLEKMFVGGQMVNTYEVENYPGFKMISGPDLSNTFKEHMLNFENIELKTETVQDLQLEGELKKVITKKNTYETKTIIFATGAAPKKLGIKGEEEFSGMGVSYCATCDGAMFRGKEVMIVGGGYTAVEDAIFLSRLCSKVHLVHRRDEFRAGKKIVDNLKKIENIEIHYDSVAEEIHGEERKVNAVSIKNLKTEELKKVDTSCIFIAIGQLPSNALAEGKIEMTEDKYIKTDAHMQTNIAGVFAAGDGRDNVMKQIITAAAEGAIAGQAASSYIANM
ncbi:MAG: thioredoxin-disulfide reductase [Defluviitaleaceae bacterium]|nr:thioredoxin-disulfide reductase [Defluviitaleaceae bacterium]